MPQQNTKVSDTTDVVPMDHLLNHKPETVAKYCGSLCVSPEGSMDITHLSQIALCSVGCTAACDANQQSSLQLLWQRRQRFRKLYLTLIQSAVTCTGIGTGAACNSTQVKAPEDEELFWDKGCWGMSSSVVLQPTVLFYVAPHCVLSVVQKQHELVEQQFVQNPSDRSISSADVHHKIVIP